jgi:spore coat polysaccharide biosynthesis predicted glycosyltransferase SpsG
VRRDPRSIVFRTDGGPAIGLGHLVRCLALAEALAARGHRCRFAGAAPDFIATQLPGGAPLALPGGGADWNVAGFRELVAGADLLVTDNYGIDAVWQRQSPTAVLAVTDPPFLDVECQMMVLPTTFAPPAGHDDALLAPKHCLIRREFAMRHRAPKRGLRLLVNAGGGEDAGLTERVVGALASYPALAGVAATVVLGAVPAERRDRIYKGLRALPNARLLERVEDMAAVIDDHDVAVGAPGGGALERACLGLAQILVPIADNQAALGTALVDRGAAVLLPAGAGVPAIADAIRRVAADAALRHGLADRAFALIDGRGAERVADAIEARLFVQ